MGCPLPHLGLGDRMLLRGLALFASRHIMAIHGVQHIRPAMDPFILAANHSSRAESLLCLRCCSCTAAAACCISWPTGISA
jgi:hypothetical protein